MVKVLLDPKFHFLLANCSPNLFLFLLLACVLLERRALERRLAALGSALLQLGLVKLLPTSPRQQPQALVELRQQVQLLGQALVRQRAAPQLQVLSVSLPRQARARLQRVQAMLRLKELEGSVGVGLIKEH